MIEIRWYVPVVGEKVLQYRQKIDVTFRAGMWDAAGIAQTADMQWSEWRTVPIESEPDPSYP
jgi:hypothetical protein